LLTIIILEEILKRKDVLFVEDVKTTIVHHKRSMTTLVIKKEG